MFLIVVQESLSNGYSPEFLDIISLICIIFGISIIISKNPILSVLFLISLFSSVSVYLMMVGLYFIGLSYLLVYVGAISILFLFILMLINVRISELLTENKNSIPLAVLIVLSFNYSVQDIIPYNVHVFSIMPNTTLTYFKYLIYNYSYPFTNSIRGTSNWILNNTEYFEIANVKSNIWDGSLVETSHIASIGNILYTNLSIWLIITSLILLLAMVGCIIITIKPKKHTHDVKEIVG